MTWELPGYDAVEDMGRGRYGPVALAREQATGAPVVLTRLSVADEPGARDAVRRDAGVLAALPADHLVPLRTVLTTPAGLVAVHDDVDGTALGDLLGTRGLGAGEAVTLGVPLARALGALHAAGVCHGDVRSDAVVVADDGRPLLAGAGMAEWAGDPVSPAHDVTRLARLLYDALDPAAPSALRAALDPAAAADDVSAERLAARLAAAGVRPRPLGTDGAPAGVATLRPVSDGQPPRRLLLALAVGAVLVAGGVLAGTSTGAPRPVEPATPTVAASPSRPPSQPLATDWLAVVRGLDGARTRALTVTDPAALMAVYAPGSPALRIEQERLARLRAAAVQPRGYDLRTTAVRALDTSSSHAVLDVVDVLSGYELVDGLGRVVDEQAPRAARRWRITLVATPDGWRIAAIAAAPSSP